jgi:hypothetical protein|tara:strand:- start:26 stop:229 length:204 start_codon:yes stop_codon:yes gene_type:complete
MLPVEGHKNLFRDENSNAIINTDNAAYNDYINSRRINADKKAELDEMKNEIETLKSMLKDLASKITS